MNDEKKITTELIEEFEKHLCNEEKSDATRDKYMRDIRRFYEFVAGRTVDKQLVIEYKATIADEYAIASANSMLAAVNSFLRFAGMHSFCVKQFKTQRKAYCDENKELTKAEYLRLVKVAQSEKNERLSLVIQTICGTGIRISELSYVTIEAVQKGEATVSCKGKTRVIFIISSLRKKLLKYAKKKKIKSGMIFVTKTGKPLNRSNVWREMKNLCKQAGVLPEKVFPHNLRHLFARTFYGIEKDIVKLADILGHSNINTTRIYTITTYEEHKRRMERMNLIL